MVNILTVFERVETIFERTNGKLCGKIEHLFYIVAGGSCKVRDGDGVEPHPWPLSIHGEGRTTGSKL
jgi:hypothetical protein